MLKAICDIGIVQVYCKGYNQWLSTDKHIINLEALVFHIKDWTDSKPFVRETCHLCFGSS